MNEAYLTSIRSASCYPAFRIFVKIGAGIAYFLAGLAVIAGLFSAEYGATAGLVAAVVIVALTMVGSEVALMVADIADASIDAGARRSTFASKANEPTSSQYDLTAPSRAELPTPVGPMGTCPNPLCSAVIPVSSENCPKCTASFGLGTWQVTPR